MLLRFGLEDPEDVNKVEKSLVGPEGVLMPSSEEILDTFVSPTTFDARNIVACPNGLLDLATGSFYEPSPLYFSLGTLGTKYVENAPIPVRWLQFLDEIWPKSKDEDPDVRAAEDADRQAKINTLQEYFGYLLTSDTRLHVIMHLIGETRSGKGTINRVLTALLSDRFVAAPRMTQLGSSDNFALQSAIGQR